MSPGYDQDFEMLDLLLSIDTDREYRVEEWPYENRTALEFTIGERERADERSQLPGFEFDWPGGIAQLVAKHDAIIVRLQE